MSQVKLTLRPPPNVDFVHGYPGIPPGAPDRPQAAVKGAIEVRVGLQGVKAKWVRIELRKVETLPGGGQANTFYDFVGPSPVNLWNSSDEYGVLKSHDFPFSIRIPESIPPSIALENQAGIKYELVASVCTRGKKSFLRKRKSTVVSTQAPIVIDKHELHSTWPVYCQPEIRQIKQDGVFLTVERGHTCYGPGDRVSVIATLKSESITTTILRGFELTLRESTVFRAGAYASGKKSAPTVKHLTVSENKFPVNATLYGGMQHKAELICAISPNHTTTTLNAARHIDITYVLSVRALMATGQHVTMDLPVIVSNWPRNVSYEAIRRIGPAQSLSLLPPQLSAQLSPQLSPPVSSPISISSELPPINITRVEPAPGRSPVVTTLPLARPNQPDYTFGRSQSAHAYSTLPSQSTSTSLGKVDEHGYVAGYGINAKPTHNPANSQSSSFGADEFGARPGASSTTTGIGRRPNSARAGIANGNNRFTITNAVSSEVPNDPEGSQQRDRAGSHSSSTRNTPWPTAEEEKLRLYETARAKADQYQESVRVITPPPMNPRLSPTQSPASALKQSRTTPSRSTPWPTAEEEKARLFDEAQAAARRAQEHDSYSPPASLHGRSNSDLSRAASTNSKPVTAAASLYSSAMSARNKFDSANLPKPAPRNPVSDSPSQHSPKSAVRIPVPQYLTAEQEKAALRRYEEAKMRVDRTQNLGYISDEDEDGDIVQQPPAAPLRGPIAYESLFPSSIPSGSSSGPGTAPPLNDNMPPPFTPSSAIPASHLSEKERLFRSYEAQDAAALGRQSTSSADAPPYSSSPPFTGEPGAGGFAGGSELLSEKELLRRKFEAQDREAMMGTPGRTSPPQPPPRTSGRAAARPAPAPPSASGSRSQRILTAVEEKALLKAKYEAEDAPRAHANGTGTNRHNYSVPHSPVRSATMPTPASPRFATSSPPAPPPLMPRPPVEYIQETQEEDARVSRLALNGSLSPLDASAPAHPSVKINGSGGNNSPGLDMRPFTPFTAGFETVVKAPGPPPPLPPKPSGD